MQFTVCVLLYGDHAKLAERVLLSLSRPAWHGKFQLRIGCNNLSQSSLHVARKLGSEVHPNTIFYDGTDPYYKYPLMRIMLHEPPITTPYTMWFDDDSWVLPSAPDDWFEQVEQCMLTKQLDVAGAPYFVHLRGKQHDWITDQPWYNGKTVKPKQRVDFITGGWLTLCTTLITRFGWPPSSVIHNGGDVMLGALCHQQDLKIGKFTAYLGINANDTGKCSTARRRGASLQPIGVDYIRGEQPIDVVEEGDWLNLIDGRRI